VDKGLILEELPMLVHNSMNDDSMVSGRSKNGRDSSLMVPLNESLNKGEKQGGADMYNSKQSKRKVL